MSDDTARDAYRKHEERGHTVATYEAQLAVARKVLEDVIRERDAAEAQGEAMREALVAIGSLAEQYRLAAPEPAEEFQYEEIRDRARRALEGAKE